MNAWAVVENVALYALAALCFFALPDWWRICGLLFLVFVNMPRRITKGEEK